MTTTEKMKLRNEISTAQSGKFAFPNAQKNASQKKVPELHQHTYKTSIFDQSKILK